jgi:ABC-type dipeptide/oligopeptide/nickel transport system permease subunit
VNLLSVRDLRTQFVTVNVVMRAVDAQEGAFFQIANLSILIPGAFLAVTVLAVNMLGDGLRDRLDPRLARRM